jgi:hypothetical protein
MINRNAIPCTPPCQVAGFPPLGIGTSTQNAATIRAPNQDEQQTRETTHPPAPPS